MTVVTDRGGKSALAKAEASHETAADIAVPAVAFEDADLEQVVLRIGMPHPLAIGQVGL